MRISVAITSYNRTDLTLESFSRVYDHPAISEIVIVDDCSTEENFKKLESLLLNKKFDKGKIFLYRNEENLGMSRNKKRAVDLSGNEWVILFDSDNILCPEYINSITEIYDSRGLLENTIYHPIKAEPDYDFNLIGERLISKENAKNFLHIREFRVFLNCCNFLVNRDQYLKTYEYNTEIQESDSIWFNYLWLKAGNKFRFVSNMKYYHRRHSGSGWLLGDHEYNLKKADEIQEKIKIL